MALRDQIAKAKAEVADVEPIVLDVELGGELVPLGFLPVGGSVWAHLTATNPPRKTALVDSRLGYNIHAVLAAYPVDKITDEGEPLTADVWADVVGLLTAPNIENIASVMFGINQLDPSKKIVELGKARASQS